MGRKRRNAVHAFFNYNRETKSSTCTVPGCSAVIKGDHGTNLLYHLSANHKEEYQIVNERNSMLKENSENDKNAQNIDDGLTGGPSKKARTCTKSQEGTYLRTQCVNLVTVHGRPFALMDDLAFKNIVAMAPVSPKEQQAINSRSIRISIRDLATNVRKNIATEIKNKMISLKIDSATRLDRTFFAVNMQYIDNGVVTIKTLGVAEMWSRSTSEHLQEKLLHILRKYHIDPNQIYTITSDNGANMLKVTRLLNETLDIQADDDISDDDMDPEYEDVIYEVTLESDNLEPYMITSVRCAAHSLQLAIQDALKEDDMIHTIEQARAIVRKLRTPTMKNLLKSAKKNKAILDNATRWHSTLDMLERLKSLRDCCSETPGEPLYLNDATWNTVDDLINSLKPSKICTKMLQEGQLTIGDFYYQWTKCYLETSHVQTPLAQQICVFMKDRENNLMKNATFASGLYLDPRFKVVLSAQEESLAIRHMKSTWLQILKVEAKNFTGESLDHEQTDHTSTSDSADAFNVDDEMERILCQTETLRRRHQYMRYVQTRSDISETLQNFCNHPRISKDRDILAFWESKALSEPQLYRLAKTVLAVPATQVSVERLFSSLKFVVGNLRSNLNENIVDDILVIRNNQ